VRLRLAVDVNEALPAEALLGVGEGRGGRHRLDEHVPILEECGPLLSQGVALFVHLKPVAVAHGQAAPVQAGEVQWPARPRLGALHGIGPFGIAHVPGQGTAHERDVQPPGLL